jgi:hypothetical protein
MTNPADNQTDEKPYVPPATVEVTVASGHSLTTADRFGFNPKTAHPGDKIQVFEDDVPRLKEHGFIVVPDDEADAPAALPPPRGGKGRLSITPKDGPSVVVKDAR